MDELRQNTSRDFENGGYRWFILVLAALTHTFATGVQSMCMPVLFAEISRSLNLSLVQVGEIWGIGFVPGLVSGIIGGALSDRIGTRLSLVILCILAGLTGALRGVSGGFAGLAVTSFLGGFMFTAVSPTVHKTCGVWFTGKRLAMANGFAAVGMALGFLLGSLLSASILSPALGGWRNVLFLYGGISALVGIVWILTKENPAEKRVLDGKPRGLSLHQPLLHIVKIRNAWILGLAMVGVGGCVRGMLGYLPLYLRGEAWAPTMADGALAAFHAVSMSAVLLITHLSDRIQRRKVVLIVAAAMTTAGVGLLSLVHGGLIWPAVILAGLVRDGFMAVFMTALIETKGIGSAHAGTAVGFTVMFTSVASLLSPPIGNSLASLSPSFPFLFWGILGLFGFICLLFLKEPRSEAAI